MVAPMCRVVRAVDARRRPARVRAGGPGIGCSDRRSSAAKSCRTSCPRHLRSRSPQWRSPSWRRAAWPSSGCPSDLHGDLGRHGQRWPPRAPRRSHVALIPSLVMFLTVLALNSPVTPSAPGTRSRRACCETRDAASGPLGPAPTASPLLRSPICDRGSAHLAAPCGRSTASRSSSGPADPWHRRRVGLGQDGPGAIDHGLLPRVNIEREGRRPAGRTRLSNEAERAARAVGQGRRDGVPGSDDLAEPVVKIGRHVTEVATFHSDMVRGRGTSDRHRTAPIGPDTGAEAPARRVPPPAVRRHAPASLDRDGPRLRSPAADRRRADHGSRRDRAGADPRVARRAATRARDGLDPRHPRPRRGRRWTDEIAVMYAGQIVERAPDGRCSRTCKSPYTEALLARSRARSAEPHRAAGDQGHGAGRRRTHHRMPIRPEVRYARSAA